MISADIGFVSADRTLVDFFVRVFEVEELEAIEGHGRTIHRLQLPNTVLKVFVPAQPPARPAPVEPFYALTGMRYLTIWVDDVDDVDAVVARAAANGAVVTMAPVQARPNVRSAVFTDPDGNAIEVAARTD